MIKRLFTDHPETVGETYWQHMGMAFSFAITMIAAGLACLVHAVFPFLCVKTGSKAITGLHDRMVTNRSRLQPPATSSDRQQAVNWQI
jgi:hypothetical protein